MTVMPSRLCNLAGLGIGIRFQFPVLHDVGGQPVRFLHELLLGALAQSKKRQDGDDDDDQADDIDDVVHELSFRVQWRIDCGVRPGTTTSAQIPYTKIRIGTCSVCTLFAPNAKEPALRKDPR